MLKRLSAAVADGDRVYAVIAGSAVNQDGASGGLTIPSGTAQTEVVSAALQRAGCGADDVDYVEAHGTGTALGDPIELNALGEALKSRRRGPVLVGSVKANIGHLEAAAGMAGLLKVVLSLQHDELPPHRLSGVLSTRVAWDRLPLEVLTEASPWPRNRVRVVCRDDFVHSERRKIGGVGMALERHPGRVPARQGFVEVDAFDGLLID